MTNSRARDGNIKRNADKLEELQNGRLPQMVDWFDPGVLGTVAVRDLISATIGDYADQRPMQAAADMVEDAVLAGRHNYSQAVRGGEGAMEGPDGRRTVTAKDGSTKSLKFDADGALWIDFIADLGDGFEATYALAYLLAQPSIKLENADDSGGSSKVLLPAGEILILGGDLAYPNATVTEYKTRWIDPYNAAFQLEPGQDSPRKLFFIAGYHDWYDGLGLQRVLRGARSLRAWQRQEGRRLAVRAAAQLFCARPASRMVVLGRRPRAERDCRRWTEELLRVDERADEEGRQDHHHSARSRLANQGRLATA